MKHKTSDTSTLRRQIQQADAKKKVNPADLSSDQDLTVALMNLISIEEHLQFTGTKTGQTKYYDLIETVRDIRRELMARVVAPGADDDGGLWGVSRRLLAASMRVSEVGTKALAAGHHADAYELFNRAYDLYSLFWGINMGLIDMPTLTDMAPDVLEQGCHK